MSKGLPSLAAATPSRLVVPIVDTTCVIHVHITLSDGIPYIHHAWALSVTLVSMSNVLDGKEDMRACSPALVTGVSAGTLKLQAS